MLTIATMTTQIRDNNIAKGWRSAAGGPGGNTFGDYVALLHSEVAEATGAYRSWKLADATDVVQPCHEIAGLGMCATHNRHISHCGAPAKPEGVGSELADVAIRLVDTADVFRFPIFDLDFDLEDVADLDPGDSDPDLPVLVTFGDHTAWLHRRIDRMWTDTSTAPFALRALATVARRFGIDLTAECTRKIAYNRTRSFRHGGALSETNA